MLSRGLFHGPRTLATSFGPVFRPVIHRRVARRVPSGPPPMCRQRASERFFKGCFRVSIRCSPRPQRHMPAPLSVATAMRSVWDFGRKQGQNLCRESAFLQLGGTRAGCPQLASLLVAVRCRPITRQEEQKAREYRFHWVDGNYYPTLGEGVLRREASLVSSGQKYCRLTSLCS